MWEGARCFVSGSAAQTGDRLQLLHLKVGGGSGFWEGLYSQITGQQNQAQQQRWGYSTKVTVSISQLSGNTWVCPGIHVYVHCCLLNIINSSLVVVPPHLNTLVQGQIQAISVSAAPCHGAAEQEPPGQSPAEMLHQLLKLLPLLVDVKLGVPESIHQHSVVHLVQHHLRVQLRAKPAYGKTASPAGHRCERDKAASLPSTRLVRSGSRCPRCSLALIYQALQRGGLPPPSRPNHTQG